MEHSEALKIAESFLNLLKPACERIEIAGSVRRGISIAARSDSESTQQEIQVNDIELVARPILTPPKPQFGDKKVFKTPMDKALCGLWKSGMIEFVKDGGKYKQFWTLEDRVHLIKVDLFLVTPPTQWGVEMAIRTGPAEFSHWIVTQKSKGGALPDGWFVKHNVVWSEGTVVPDDPIKSIELMCELNSWEMPEEKDFLDFLGLGWIEPGDRKAEWRQYVKQ